MTKIIFISSCIFIAGLILIGYSPSSKLDHSDQTIQTKVLSPDNNMDVDRALCLGQNKITTYDCPNGSKVTSTNPEYVFNNEMGCYLLPYTTNLMGMCEKKDPECTHVTDFVLDPATSNSMALDKYTKHPCVWDKKAKGYKPF